MIDYISLFFKRQSLNIEAVYVLSMEEAVVASILFRFLILGLLEGQEVIVSPPTGGGFHGSEISWKNR